MQSFVDYKRTRAAIGARLPGAGLKCAAVAFKIVMVCLSALWTAPAQAGSDICKALKTVTDKDPMTHPSIKYRPKERICREWYWSNFKARPLKDVLSGDPLARYKRALGRKDCKTAAEILRKGFTAAHPKAESIVTNQKNFKDWKKWTVGNHYPLLKVCLLLETIRRAQRELDLQGINIPRYQGPQKSSQLIRAVPRLPTAVLRRNSALFLLEIYLVGRSHPASVLALLKLSLDGKVVKYRPRVELFFALMLRDKGRNDPIIDRVIKRPIDPKIRRGVEEIFRNRSRLGKPIYADED